MYHVKLTEFEGDARTSHSKYAIAPLGEVKEIEHADMQVEGTAYFDSLPELADELVKRGDPPQIYKLPNGMPARSSHIVDGALLIDYMRRGLSPRERDELVEGIRNILLDS